MNLRLLLILLLFLNILGMLGGCGAGKRVVFVPESTGLVRLGPDVRGHVYYWNGETWESSKNTVCLPEGWYAGSLPSESLPE
tara:strand:+ start:11244 stop:11489 length:246 start_codon:yes stop_codon:yes gene_type:complete